MTNHIQIYGKTKQFIKEQRYLQLIITEGEAKVCRLDSIFRWWSKCISATATTLLLLYTYNVYKAACRNILFPLTMILIIKAIQLITVHMYDEIVGATGAMARWHSRIYNTMTFC